MKSPFEYSLRGQDWWKPFLPFWLVYVAYIVVTQVGARANKGNPSGVGAMLLLTFGLMIVFTAIASVFTIIFMRILFPKFKAGDKGVEFSGEIWPFVGRVVGGLLLSLITIGFYAPWFCRNMVSYLASQTRFGGSPVVFRGKPGKLLVYGLLSFVLPVIALVVVLILLFKGMSAPSDTSPLLSILIMAFTFIILTPYLYLVYRWYVDFESSGARIRWRTKFWPSCGFILGQICLTAITLGIYWPAAFLKIYKYFAERTVLESGDAELGRLYFEGKLGEGFLLLWGQCLLSIVTLGIYLPWAIAKTNVWLIGQSGYSGGQEQAAATSDLGA